MTTKKNEDGKPFSSIKGLVVRSVEESRNRAGYHFTSEPQFVDVQEDGLLEEDTDAILNDRYLMAVEVDKAPKGASNAQRVTPDGGRWTKGNIAIGNATLETATREMQEAAEAGEEPPLHPSAPGGEPIRGNMNPEAVEENIKRLEQQQMPDGVQPTARKRGRPSKAQATAKKAAKSGPDHSPANEGVK